MNDVIFQFKKKINEDSLSPNNVLLTDGTYCDKIEAHVRGSQHYAFSIFLFDSNGNLLLQRRSKGKYHSGGLWSNTCCSHPLSVSSIKEIEEQAKARLFYEMGMDDVSLHFEFSFAYNEQCSNYIENEIDYVFSCVSNQMPQINEEEVADYKWISIKNLQKELHHLPETFTIWFRRIIELHGDKLFANTNKIIGDSCYQL